ncbi:MAG: hypothetical protein KC501_18870 [Myxococcales bacterium]|nr:hypothetical protein [Myxococcales bacterium]
MPTTSPWMNALERHRRGPGRSQSAVQTIALMGALAMSTVASAEPASPPRLEVVIEPGLEDAELFPGWVAELEPELEPGSSSQAEGPAIRVEIGGRYLDYRYRVVALRDGEPVVAPSAAKTCECSRDDLLLRIDQELDASIDRLAAASEPEPRPEPRPGPEPGPSPQPALQQRRMTWRGGVGIGVGAMGLGGVIAGSTMIGIGERIPVDAQHLSRDLRTPGIAVLGAGSVVLAAGLGLLIADLVICRKHGPWCRVDREGEQVGDRPRLAPWVSTTGLGLAGRF